MLATLIYETSSVAPICYSSEISTLKFFSKQSLKTVSFGGSECI